MEDSSTPEDSINLITSTLDYFGHNGYLKILIGCVWGKEGVEGGGKGLIQSRLTIKRALEIIISNWVIPLRSL